MGRIVFSFVLTIVVLLTFTNNTFVRPCKEHYENKELNFSIDYPSGWITQEDKDNSTVIFTSREKDSLGKAVAEFYVHFPEWTIGMKEKDFEETLINSYYNQYNQVRISYQEKDDQSRKSWGLVELFAQKGIEPIKYVRTYYDYNAAGTIIISYQTVASKADKYKDIIESSIKSFKYKQPS